MATFSKASFDSARYAAARPTYPRQLFDAVLQYHARSPAAQWHTAVDLGCGTGACTLLPPPQPTSFVPSPCLPYIRACMHDQPRMHARVHSFIAPMLTPC